MKEQNLPPRPDIPSYWRELDRNQLWLHLGENPLPPTPYVADAIASAALHANRYPDTNAWRLREHLAHYVGHGVGAENIVVGNGSDDLIDLCVLTFASPDQAVLTFEPTFFVYRFCSHRHGISVWPFQRTIEFDLPQADDINMSKTPVCLTFIANPNNPTGTLTQRDHLLELIDALPGMIVVDECYFEFCGETIVDLVKDNKRLIVLRSLSKSFGLSGLRLGYAVAHDQTIELLERNALTFPVNAIAQAAGIAALEDIETYQQRIQDLIKWRDEFELHLLEFGLEIPSSFANFLLTLWPQSALAHEPGKALAEKGVLVSDQTRNINQNRPALRFGVGTPEENARVIEVLKEIKVS